MTDSEVPQSVPDQTEQKNPKSNLSKGNKEKKSKKRVHFARSESGSLKAKVSAYIPLRSEISTEEARTIWWNRYELEQLMLSARSMCRTKRDDLQLSCHLIRAYDSISEKVEAEQQKQNDEDEDNDAIDPDFDIENRHIKRAISQLSKWEINSDHRGLETWTSYEHELSRENAQRELTRLILAAQRTHRMRYGRICKKGSEESDILWDKVSDVSNRYSRHARIFAYTMGQADAAEVGIEIYPKKHKNNLFKKVAKAIGLFRR